jgi:hypothetical protein
MALQLINRARRLAESSANAEPDEGRRAELNIIVDNYRATELHLVMDQAGGDA